MGCEDSELWITYKQNSRGNKPATTQLIELEFQSHKLNDLEDVLDHVFTQGWVEAQYRSISWWEKHDGTKLKNGERIETLLKEGAGKCESTSLRLVIADCPSVIWISYVFLKSPNAHVATQRIDLTEAADPCGKVERLAHITNFVFRKGYLPAKVRSLVHWEDACKKCIEEHVCVKDVLCQRDGGKTEDRPLRLVIGLDFALVAELWKLETDFASSKTTPLVSAKTPDNILDKWGRGMLSELANAAPSPYFVPSPATLSPSSQTPSTITSLTSLSLIVVDRAPWVWTLHFIFFGIIVFLSWTAILYLRVYCCVCEHCPIQ